jgi:ribosomal protein S18 acetylase RimI-like enzyme
MYNWIIWLLTIHQVKFNRKVSFKGKADMIIEIIHTVTDELLAAFARLAPQLSETMVLPSRAQLEEIVVSPVTSLFIARDADEQSEIIGLLTLAVYRSPAGVSAHIEDVVVDQKARGRGAGEALTRAAMTLAEEKGAKKIDLTSRPSREAANRLYQRLGFVLWKTNFYRYIIPNK